MNKKPISLVHTPCKLCVFADYSGITQIGCKLGYIEKYKEKKIEVLEVFDHEKNFYVINNKKCLGYRDKKWLENKDNIEESDLCNLVKKENSIKYIVIIKINDKDSEQEFKDIIESLLKQKILPKGIVIYKKKWINYDISNEFILNYMDQYSGILYWRIKNFLDKDMSEKDLLKAAISSCAINRFYFLLELKNSIPDNCIENIQNYIDSGGNFGCLNIYKNLFFSQITAQYCQNILKKDLLNDNSLQTNYEAIN